jgi:hypothetical protein
VLGVTAGSMLVCHALKIDPPLSYKFLLPLAVWMLYLADHIADGIRHAGKLPATRYNVYYSKRKPLIALLILLVLISISILLFSFDKITFHFGLLVGLFVLVYFSFQQLRYQGKIHLFPKEPLIAIVYSLGIWGEPLLMFKGYFSFDLYFSFFSFALLVFMNVQLCSILQIIEDTESGYPSLARAFGSALVSRVNFYSGLLIALLCFLLIFRHVIDGLQNVGIIFMIMDISLIVLTLISRHSSRRELIGILNDAVFFLPFLALLLGR